MSFFGILSAKAELDVTVGACHLNLWSLDGLLGRRVLLLDVGMRIRALPGKKPEAVTIVVPAPVSGAPFDLAPLIKDSEDIRTLIFARAVPCTDDFMQLGADRVQIVLLEPHKCKCERQDDYSSEWTIHLSEPLSESHDSYVRFRLRLATASNLWGWRREWGLRNRSIVDFRIADVRGVTTVSNAHAFVKRIVPISKLNLFVIAPLWMRMRFASPDLEYVRLFEGKIWEKYLGRASGLRKSQRLVIYQWETSNVGAAKPFRAFLDLTRDPDVVSIGNNFRATLLLAGVALIVLATVTAAQWWELLSPFVTKHWPYVVSLFGLALFGKLASMLEKVEKAYSKGMQQVERFETWLFQKLAK